MIGLREGLWYRGLNRVPAGFLSTLYTFKECKFILPADRNTTLPILFRLGAQMNQREKNHGKLYISFLSCSDRNCVCSLVPLPSIICTWPDKQFIRTRNLVPIQVIELKERFLRPKGERKHKDERLI